MVYLVVGKESVGKSRLISALTNAPAQSGNFRGTTVSCHHYRAAGREFIDTPGILRDSDTETTRLALAALEAHDTVILVVQATQIDADLHDLLPLVAGKSGLLVITFWDKVQETAQTSHALAQLGTEIGVPVIPVNARHLCAAARKDLLHAAEYPGSFTLAHPRTRIGWHVEPPPTILEWRWIGPLLALILLLLPAITAVWIANGLAGVLDPLVAAFLTPLVTAFSTLPQPGAAIVAGRYGLLSMGPLLFVWAVPTVIIYALWLGIYKASGLIDRISVALHPLMRTVGLSGRDVTRVVMGFGCNVPAVISTRACSRCSRRTTIATIAFGAACSYQFGATIGVFAAAGMPSLVLPYAGYLILTSLIYARLVAPAQARSRQNAFMIPQRGFLEWPSVGAVRDEALLTLREFFAKAVPIFVAITVVAGMLDWLGVVAWMAGLLEPVMALFNLPKGAALPMLMASIRKDGLLLFADPLLLATLTPLQVLTGVYLGGVLLPCLVTALTIAREQSWGYALRLMVQQALMSSAATFVLGWTPLLFTR